MKARLAPSWELSTEHAVSSYGQPVLVHRVTGEAYGAGDIVRLYPSYGLMPAAHAIRRLANTRKLSAKAQTMVARFVALHPSP